MIYTDLDPIKNFVIFLGHPRSGHSVIGAALDAHPNACIANEANALYRAGYEGCDPERTMTYLLNHRRRNAKNHKWHTNHWQRLGFDYRIPGQSINDDPLYVIGDKKAGGSIRTIKKYGFGFVQNFIANLKSVGIGMKFIVVIRNPFEVITSLYTRGLMAGVTPKAQPGKLHKMIKYYETNCKVLESVLPLVDYHTICHEDFVLNSRQHMIDLLNFLELESYNKFQSYKSDLVECDHNDYLDQCCSVFWTEARKGRYDVLDQWTERNRMEVRRVMGEFDFLYRYENLEF